MREKEGKRENEREREKTRFDVGFQSPPHKHTSSKKAKCPNPSKIVSLPDEEAFKYMRLCGPFLFKPPRSQHDLKAENRRQKGSEVIEPHSTSSSLSLFHACI